eukprot:scaffold539_cov186-Alexandrium_tamarense.AAC.6
MDDSYIQLHPHAFHLQLPSHHKLHIGDTADSNRDGTEGGLRQMPYLTLHAQARARGIWKLVKSLEVIEGLYCEDHAAADWGVGMDGEEEEEDDDEEVPTMVRLDSPLSMSQL